VSFDGNFSPIGLIKILKSKAPKNHKILKEKSHTNVGNNLVIPLKKSP